MTYYISEILDAGQQGPLFMVNFRFLCLPYIYIIFILQYLDILLHLQVTVENCPGEIFINISPTKCWNMVRERLNMEIRRQINMGRANLPTLQPPGSVDGHEMFGLLTPAIVQVWH
jgi:histone demethylase JARID1